MRDEFYRGESTPSLTMTSGPEGIILDKLTTIDGSMYECGPDLHIETIRLNICSRDCNAYIEKRAMRRVGN